MSRIADRIVSLLPGATEWICFLGLGQRLVGVSHECDFPSQVASLPKVTRSRIDANLSSREIDAAVRDHSDSKTSLYDLGIDQLAALQPDLIVTQSLCNVCAVSESDVRKALTRVTRDCRILDLNWRTLDQVFDDAAAIVEQAGQTEQGARALESLADRVGRIRHEASCYDGPRPTVTLLEWLDPLYCAGHWTPDLIQWCGGTDPIGRAGQESRMIDPSELFAADPDILLVAARGLDAQRTAEEFGAIQRRREWSELRCVRNDNVHLFDGSALFNRPGPRLVEAMESVATLIRRWQSDNS